MSGDPILEVTGLRVDYALASGRLRAVDDVALSLRAGGSLGIAGASGSGKSTVALALLGLLDGRSCRMAGTIHFEGRHLAALDDEGWRAIRGRGIGAVFQSPQGTFNPTMTIGQHLEEALRMRFGGDGADGRRRAMDVLDKVGMPRAAEVLGSYAFELSGGMCQRAAIALALAQEPGVLIADEPTSSLDVIAQAEICRLLRTLNAEHGVSLIVISHDLGLIGRLAGQVAVMQAGRVVETGATAEVFANPRHPYTRQLIAAAFDDEPAPARPQELAS